MIPVGGPLSGAIGHQIAGGTKTASVTLPATPNELSGVLAAH